MSRHVSITGLIITVSTARQESGSQHATPTCEIDSELPYVQDNDKQASIFPTYDLRTKTMSNCWTKADDNKLLQLLQTNTINPTLTFQAIETVRTTHWPDKEYKSFAQLYRKKVRKWSAEQTLQSARRGESCFDHVASIMMLLLSCSCLIFQHQLACTNVFCSSSSSSAGVVVPPAAAVAPPAAAVAPPAAVVAPPAAVVAAQATPTRRAVRSSRDNNNKKEEEGNEDEEEESDFSVGEDDNSESRGKKEEEAEEIADADVNEAAEELELLLLHSTNDDEDEMQYFLYQWFDESGRERLTVEFLVIGLAEEDFSANVSRNGMSLMLTYTIPDVFFNPDRLLTASDGEVTETHSKYAAFTKAVHAYKSSIPNGYDKPIEKSQRVKLPFKVEQEFAKGESNDDGDETSMSKGFELHAFPHPNKKMRKAKQFMFVFAVDLVSVVKPQSLKKAKPRKTAFRVVDSCESPDSDDEGAAMSTNGD